jgi:CspA family cold shock protein
MQGIPRLSEEIDGSDEAAGVDNAGNGGAQDAAQTDEAISGRVKWFDIVKGYGFVTPTDGGGDILVHYNLLAPLGRKSLPEGATVSVVARQGARGRQASAILDLDLSTAVGPDPDRAQERASNRQDPLDFLDQAGDFEPVQVRWFNRAKGYGFLLRNDGVTQVFVHMETVRRAGLENLLPGQDLSARIFDGPKGALAVLVQPTGAEL